MKKSYLEKFIFVIFCVFYSLLLISSGNKVLAADFPDNPIEKLGYILDFQDEFNETSLDTNKWVPYYLPHWTSLELASPDYVIDDGILKLKINEDTEPWCPKFDGDTRVSGIMTGEKTGLHNWTGTNTVQTQMSRQETYVTKYGYFEIRAKVQEGGGIHSAWWMIGMEDTLEQSSEVDCFEILGRNSNEIQTTRHSWSDPNITYQHKSYTPQGENLADEFHIYAVDWYPGGMDFYFDNIKYAHMDGSPNYEMMSMFSLYEKRSASWTGPFDSSIPYPKTFEIDYFRVYKNIVDETNLALQATISTTSNGNIKYPIQNSIDGIDVSAYQSAVSPEFPTYVTLVWEDGQEFNTIDLSTWYAQGQAPTSWAIEVSDDGQTNWTPIASVNNISWETNDQTVENKRISFSKVQNKKGLRLKINSSNLQWNVFAINEISILNL